MNRERYYKLDELRSLLGVSRSTIWRWHAERGLKVVTIGGVVRVKESDLQEFLARHELSTSPVASPRSGESKTAES